MGSASVYGQGSAMPTSPIGAGFPFLALSEPTFDFLSRKGTGGGREEVPYQVPGRVGHLLIVTL